jgi:hypothetical protein
MNPVSKSGLIIEEVNGEFLLFDESSNVAAALNASAAAVLELCDGSLDLDAIVLALAGTATPLGEDEVMLALSELVDVGVVEHLPDRPVPSRRDMLKKMGAAAAVVAALPWVESIVAPSLAAATSGVTPGPSPSFPTPPPSFPTPSFPTPSFPSPSYPPP